MTSFAIQKAVAEAKADYEKKEADVLVASKKLSAGAQELVGKIKVIYLHVISAFPACSFSAHFVLKH